VNDLCASFQRAVTEALMAKVNLAVKLTGIRKVSASGGVSANNSLRESLSSDKRFRAWLPSKSRCTDNAAMIAVAGHFKFLNGETCDVTAPPFSRVTI